MIVRMALGICFNFGLSDWARNRPTLDPREENVVTVPFGGALLPLDGDMNVHRRMSGMPAVYDTLDGYPVVTVKGPRMRSAPDTERIVHFVWIMERREWIIIVCERHLEMVYMDEAYSGPYAMSPMYMLTLMGTFGVPVGKTYFDELRRLSPEELNERR